MEIKTTIKANEIIKAGIALLPDEAKKEWKASASDIFIDEAIETANHVLENPSTPEKTEMYLEKSAMLEAYAVQEANRMASTLWRLELLTEELEKEYRSLPSLVEVVKPYNEFLDKRNARADELAKLGNELQEEKKDLDIFMGIINGIPAEESEKRYQEFKNAQQAAMAGAR